MRALKLSLICMAMIGLSLQQAPITPAAAGVQPNQRPVSVAPGAPAGFDPAKVAINLLEQVRTDHGLLPGDLDDVVVTDVVESDHTSAVHVYLQQRYRGIVVEGATANFTIDRTGEVVGHNINFKPDLAKAAPRIRPKTLPAGAAAAAANALGLSPSAPFMLRASAAGDSMSTRLSDGGVSRSEIPAELRLIPTADGTLALAWNLTIEAIGDEGWWQINIDADSGDELGRVSYVAHDSYNVIPQPTEAPSFGARAIVNDPADPTASPFGWHDTDGVAGAESTLTSGNNVTAYTDTDFDNNPDPGSQPDGGATLDFDFAFNPLQAPSTNADAAVTNLFYWNNIAHDVLYAFGFDEAAGNFQMNNYGNGGLGSDPVRAEALDGEALNNANFATPPDGQSPRMQMFVWNNATPNRSSSFDSGVVVHEYAHGLSNRLTGGPSNVSCLQQAEQPGEGWSDYVGLMLTMQPGQTGADPRGIGTYLLGQPPTGAGIRAYPYSTNMLVDPRTYGDVANSTAPHGVGSIFATMLWEMTWALIDRDGFDPDLINGAGGNTTALQLVIDAMKIQPCNPGFVDARDAIITADQLLTGGTNRCLIWESFAKRGLGYSASQGSSASHTDGVEAFDIPPDCTDLSLTLTGPTIAAAGEVIEITASASNNTASIQTGVSASLDLHNASYVDGSATCPAVSGTTLDLQLGDIGPAGSAACRFLARVTTAATEVLLDDDFESGLTSWAVTSPAGPDQWSAVSTDSHSPNNSAFAIDSITTSDQQMTTTSPITMGTSTVLRFWHRYDFENRYDGGVVEISEDGGTTWVGTQNLFVSGGYPTSLFSTSNPLSGRPAFTGDSGGWKESALSLDPYQGFDLMFRFRVGTDASVGAPGWWVDDVRLANEVGAIVSGTATATTPATTSQPAQLQTEIHEGGLLRVTTDPPVPSQITLDGVRMNRWGLNWLRVAPGSYELCFSDVIDWTAPPCQTVVIEDGTTTTAVGTFSQRGFLRVETSPPVPSTITIDGEPADDWGLWIDIDPGNYEVCFGAVADYATPPCQQVTVSAGALETVTGSFTPQPGSPGPAGHGLLRATTSPALPSMISINGNPADRWGLDWVKLAPGSYDVCFSDIHLYVAPDCRTVEVVAGQVTATEGVFEQLGDLRVVTAPPQPSTIYVDGLPRDAWGLWTDLPVGDHIVCFEGWAGFTPPCETTTLTALNTTVVEGTWP